MTRHTYIVNDETFTTKDALEQRVKGILNHPAGPRTLHPDDTAFIYDLLLQHPRADEKIGAGVVAIEVRRGPMNSNQFILLRADGSSLDFSYRKCIRPVTHATEVKAAARRAIESQVIAFKRQHLPSREAVVICVVTGEPVTWVDAHVDHEPPRTFAALLEQWMAEQGLDFDDIALVDAPKGGKLLAPAAAAAWGAWHAAHAQLRVISAYANMHLVR